MKDDLFKLPKYSRQFPQRPDKMKSPEIEEGLPFVEMTCAPVGPSFERRVRHKETDNAQVEIH